VVADPLTEALACARRVAGLPRQAVESTKRILNLQLERAVRATLDFATTAEEQSFATRTSARSSPSWPRLRGNAEDLAGDGRSNLQR
jgi:hypothetical protein